MEGLPLIPGYSFHDPTVRDFKLKQKFSCKGGYRVLRDSDYGVGRRPNDAASCAYVALDPDPIESTDCTQAMGTVNEWYDPSLTYGRIREYPYSQVIPHYALFAQKCLNFKAFFRQGVFNSPDEHYRIRHVNIIYFLEDDTLSVMEPTVENSGFRQGRLVRRGKVVKDRDGRVYHWKDLDVGIDIAIYGVVYHTVDCDLFTREFMRSQGIDVADRENAPVDPYTQRLAEREKYDKLSLGGTNQSRGIVDDPRRRFLEYDGMVLRFDATWNDEKYQVMYYLSDDTIAVKEIHKPNDGKDPVPMLLKRTRLPKNWKNLPSTYPAVYMEVGDPEVVEYYSPKDLTIGETIFIFGRRFLLRDCDSFTRKYYSEMLCSQQPGAMIPDEETGARTTKIEARKPPPHIAYGSPEDTLASCESFMPRPPKQDVIRQLYNSPKKLRYLATMEAVHPEDEGRDFLIDYSLSDGKITISEIEKRNSGRRGGCFLSSSLVPKPATGRDNPLYYTPEDFFIGARLNFYNHRFVITGIDLFVYRYVEANPEKFCRELRDNLRNYVTAQGLLEDDVSRRALENIENQAETGDDPSNGEPPSMLSTQEYMRVCENEAPAESVQRERCNFDEPETPEVARTRPTKDDELLAPERKRLVWADQIDEDSAGHTLVSCKPEVPQCATKRPAARRGCLKLRDDDRKIQDKKFEVDQQTYGELERPVEVTITSSAAR